MEAKSRFQRSFLIFENEDSGYEAGQNPSGYIKLEVREGKGRLRVSVQNLRELRGDNRYELYFLNMSKALFSMYKAGALAAGNNGYSLEQDFNPQNAFGSGAGIDKLDTAVILAENSDDRSGQIKCPLAAYRNSKTIWRQKASQFMRERHSRQNVQPMLNLQPVGALQTAVEQERADIPFVSVEDRNESAGLQAYVKDSAVLGNAGLDNSNIVSSHSDNSDIDNSDIDNSNRDNFDTDNSDTDSAALHDSDSDNSGIPDTSGRFDAGEADDGTGFEANDNKTSYYEQTDEKLQDLDDNDRGGYTIAPADETAGDERLDSPGPGNTDGQTEHPAFDSVNTGCMYMNSSMCSLYAKGGDANPCAGCRAYSDSIKTNQNAADKPGNIELVKEMLDRNFEGCDPFGSHRSDYRWWKVTNPVNLNNILYECGIRSPLLFNPAVMMSHYKYRHLITGVYNDRYYHKEYLICGVPGMHMVDKRPFADMCRWVQLDGSRPVYGAFGYWLVYIDPKTGSFLNIR